MAHYDLNNFIDWNSLCIDASFLLFTEIGLSDSNFLVNHVLLKHLSKDHFVGLLTTTRSFHHYAQISTKFGINLRTCQEKGLLCVIETLKQASDSSYGGGSENSDSGSLEPMDLCRLQQQIKDFVNSVAGKHLLLVIDDLSVFLNIGMELRQVVNFVECCRSLLGPLRHCLAVVVYEDDDESDFDNVRLSRILAHRCDWRLTVANLATGFSKDVHGDLTLEKRNPRLKANYTPLDTSTFHYKIEDKKVSIFATGTSAAVL